VPLNAWFRVEIAVTGSATAGQVEVKRFDSADSVTPDETITSAATQNTRGTMNHYRFGSAGDPLPASRTMWLDNLAVTTTGGYLGPACPRRGETRHPHRSGRRPPRCGAPAVTAGAKATPAGLTATGFVPGLGYSDTYGNPYADGFASASSKTLPPVVAGTAAVGAPA
jgi:hypothetical protein